MVGFSLRGKSASKRIEGVRRERERGIKRKSSDFLAFCLKELNFLSMLVDNRPHVEKTDERLLGPSCIGESACFVAPKQEAMLKHQASSHGYNASLSR